jgi:hypothetical protein
MKCALEMNLFGIQYQHDHFEILINYPLDFSINEIDAKLHHTGDHRPQEEEKFDIGE